MPGLESLPEECISHFLSLTSPKAACRSSLVCTTFRSAALSDVLWDRFLPSDYNEIISRSISPVLFSSKKEPYLHLCQNPVPLDEGNLSFALDEFSGKKCFMLGARHLFIAWGDTPDYWEWISLSHSRFSQVAELKLVWWLEIKGCIETKNLSPRTKYTAYLVYKLPEESKWGFEETPITLHIVYEQSVVAAEHSVILDPLDDMPPHARRRRRDGWMEIEMGEFFNEGGDNATVECSLRETSSEMPKSGLIVEGIEIRPRGV